MRYYFHGYTCLALSLACALLTFATPSQSRVNDENYNDVTEGGGGDGLDAKQGEELSLTASCSDYPSCQLDLSLLKKAVKEQRREKACGHVRASFHCQRSATRLCEKEGVVNPDGLVKMRRAYIYTEIFVQEMCYQDSSSSSSKTQPTAAVGNTRTNGGAHCSQFRSCFVDVKRYKEAAHSDHLHEACSIAINIYECAASAMLDCRRGGALSSEALDLIEDTTVQAGIRVDNVCAFITTTPSSLFGHVTFHCVDFATCPKPDLDTMQVAKRTGEYHDVCRSITPHVKCLKGTIADCEAKQLVSPKALQSMKESLAKAKENVKMYCPFYEMEVLMGRMMLSAPEVEPGFAANFDLGATQQTLTCLDIGLCPLPTTPAGKYDRKAYQDACKSMRAHTSCIDYATEDCKVRSLVTSSAYPSMIKAVEDAKELTEYYCTKAEEVNAGETSDVSTIHPLATCLEMRSCPQPWTPPSGKKSRDDLRKACRSITAHASCMDHATNDCRTRKLVTGSALKSLLQSVDATKRDARYYCQKSQEHDSHNGGFAVRPPSFTIHVTVYVILCFFVLCILDKSELCFG